MFLYGLVIFTILGLFVGSFLNVCIDRLPKGQSIAYPPSHCTGCGQKLQFVDLIPVVSYLHLHGRCRDCGVRIPRRIPIVEATTGILFLLLFWKYGIGIELLISIFYASLFLVIFVIDLETMYVLSVVAYPAMVVSLVFAVFWPGIVPVELSGALVIDRLASSLAGGLVGFGVMAAPYLISRLVYKREGMGKGDIQLGVIAGLSTGYPFAMVALFIAIIAGGVTAVVLLVFKIKKRTDPVPFGPFLVAAAMVTLLWGQDILTYYGRIYY